VASLIPHQKKIILLTLKIIMYNKIKPSAFNKIIFLFKCKICNKVSDQKKNKFHSISCHYWNKEINNNYNKFKI